jgi:DNA polymerase-3 subunit epsilon
MDFVALDFETANSDLSSICQVGVAGFDNDCLCLSWEALVNPDDYFDPFNVSIHGITEEMVASSPTWPQIYPTLAELLKGKIVVTHTAFDRVASHQACKLANIMETDCTWLDSARVVRRTWTSFARSGYGLANVASELGIEYTAHNALEDARCAGEVLLRAIKESGLDISRWLSRVTQPIFAIHQLSEYVPNSAGPLAGEILVFTGALFLTRHEAAALAARAGCSIADGVTKHTTLLVVGDQDSRKLAGYEKSSKHRKAEALIAKGQHIRILSEDDFRATVVCCTKANELSTEDRTTHT